MSQCCEEPNERLARLERSLGALLVRKRRLVVGLAALVVAVAGLGAARIGLNADFVSYLSAEDPLVQAYHHVASTFGGNETGVALITAPDIVQPHVLRLIDALTEAYEGVDGVGYVTSLTNTLAFEGTDWGIEVGRLVPPERLSGDVQDLAAVRGRIARNPRVVGSLVSADWTLAAIQLRLADNGGAGTEATVRRIIEVTDAVLDEAGAPPEVAVHYGGMPFLMRSISVQITENMAVLTPLVLAFLILILYLGLRHWTGVVYPVVVVLLSSVFVLGLMGFLGLPLDLLSGLVPVVLIVLGSADGIHFMKRYHERRSAGDGAEAAATAAYRELKKPLVLTTFTTMIGFGSLGFSGVVIVRQFGLLTAAGLLFALVVTLLLLPALAGFGVGAPRPASRGHGAGAGTRLAGLVARRPGGIITGAAAVVVLAAGGILFVVRSVDWTLCLKPGSSPHRAEMLLREKLGGSLPIQLLVAGDLLDPAALRVMRATERRMDALPSVSGSQSLAGLLAEMNEAVNGRYAVPATRDGAANLWFLIENEEALEQIVAQGNVREGLVQGRVADWETPSIRDAVEGIDVWSDSAGSVWAVVDPRRVKVARVGIEHHRAADLLTQLLLEFRARDESPPPELTEATARFISWTPGPTARAQVADAVFRYVTGPDAEALIEPATARRLADRLAVAAGVWGVDASTAASVVRAVAPAVAEADAAALALSLQHVTYDAAGSHRVARAMAELTDAAPILVRSEALRRNVEGAFWEAHDPLVVAPEPVVATWALEDSAIVRVVPVDIHRSGLASVLDRMERELLPTQIQSVLITAVLVLLVLSVLFRSLGAGALMVLPLAGAVVLNFGAMGYLGLGLDSFTAMVAAIAIGLGVDYSIHFTHRLRRELAGSGGDLRVGLERALRTSGVAISINAVSVGTGFLVLLAASCQHVRRFGGLTSLTMFAAGLFTLLVLPSLYLTIRPRFLRAADAGAGNARRTAPGDRAAP